MKVEKYKDVFDKRMRSAEKGYNEGGPVNKCKIDGIATQGFTKAFSLKKGK